MEEPKAPAPILTKAQQKKAISGTSKVQKRKVVLNVLDSPLDLDWPRIGAGKEEEIKVLLKEHLSPVRARNISVPRSIFTEIPKEERALWKSKEKESARNTVAESKSRMSDLLLGFRDVVRAAGKGEACLVFCEKTPDPPILTRLLAPLCQSNNIPLIAIKDFSQSVKNLLHVPRCLTMALKLSAREVASPLNTLYQKCINIYQSSGLSVPGPAFDSISSAVATGGEAKEPPVMMEIVDVASSKNPDTPREVTAVTEPIERFYLKKCDLGPRFVPGVTKNPLRSDDHVDDSRSVAADFICLSNEPTLKRPSTTILRYHQIKQVHPNENKKQKRKKSGM